MSQDMFSEDDVCAFLADVEDNDADDPGGYDTPVEFSGVSASSTSSSPGSQQMPPPPARPSPALAVTRPTQSGPSGSQVFPCPVCQKILQTKRGFTGHMNRFHGRETSILSVPTPVPTPAASPQVQSYKCPDCASVLTTKSGFSRHRAAHKLKEIAKKIPTASQFKEEALDSTIQEIISELLCEPYSGEESSNVKLKFLKEYSSLKGSKGRCDFEATLANAICPLV